MKPPIYLVGFPGCGKTTIGREFAVKLGMRFIDMDAFICKENGVESVVDFVSKYGMGKFREQENYAIERTRIMGNIVVACGGGCPIHSDNMRKIWISGFVVYLTESRDTLVQRLYTERESRPMFCGKTESEIEEWLTENWRERESVYEKADVKANADRLLDFLRD